MFFWGAFDQSDRAKQQQCQKEYPIKKKSPTASHRVLSSIFLLLNEHENKTMPIKVLLRNILNYNFMFSVSSHKL
jgi:hypothetical protein